MTRRIIQIYRGTTAQNDAFTGSAGELTMDTTRKELRVHDGSTVGGKVVGLTPGFIAPFAGSTAPDGWLICDGSAVSRTTYAALFAIIGTTYGAGDGNSTFNLPNYTYARLLTGTAVDVYGNGGAFGTTNRNIQTPGGDYYMEAAIVSGAWRLAVSSDPSTTGVGLTTNANKSNVVGSIKYSTPVKMCIKY